MQNFKKDKFGGIHGWINVEDDARIHVRIRGNGSPILVMGGIGSGAFSREEVANLFAKKHMVISYDRRCTFRSTGNPDSTFDFAQQCRDIVHILDACKIRSVSILATCSSASIAMHFLSTYSGYVDMMLIHDPICLTVLPDAEVHLKRFEEYCRISLEGDHVAALGAFLADFELPFPIEFQKRVRIEGSYMTGELISSLEYKPDICSLQSHKNRLVMAAGQQCIDRGFSTARTAQVLSDQIGCKFAVVPGNHTGYFQDPGPFTDAALNLLVAPASSTYSAFELLRIPTNQNISINQCADSPSVRVNDQSTTGLNTMSHDSLNNLNKRLKNFARVRDWEKFHNPKNLTMAMISECAELVEHFQWLTPEQSTKLPHDKRHEVALEMADILIYLIRCAERLNIDLIEAAEMKIEINEVRFPVDKVYGGSAQIAAEYE
jgi:NTP pyrophosphatase (non-canonical NTP hydrolase)